MNMIDLICDLATKQIGNKEQPKGSNHVVPYTTDYGYDGAWCVMFQWWLFKECGLSYLFYGGRKTASCTTLMNWAKLNHLDTNTPQRGDLVIFQWDNGQRHIELIIDEDKNNFITIGGNVSDEVKQMKRPKNKNIYGFIHPEYTEIKYTTKKGSVWSAPLKIESNKERQLEVGHGVSCYIPEFTANGERWYKTIKNKYVLAKIFE